MCRIVRMRLKKLPRNQNFKILILYFINLCAYIQAYGVRWLAVLLVLKKQYYNTTSAQLQPNKDVIIIFTATRYDIIQYSTIQYITTLHSWKEEDICMYDTVVAHVHRPQHHHKNSLASCHPNQRHE